MTGRDETVATLQREHPRTDAEIRAVDPRPATPGALFRLLSSARIRSGIATEAVRGLSAWQRRVKVLNEAGYARSQERTATPPGEAPDLLLDSCRGDLRRLREEAGRDRTTERRPLQRVPGMGRVGAGIVLREVQAVWSEVRPYADRRPLTAARARALPALVQAGLEP